MFSYPTSYLVLLGGVLNGHGEEPIWHRVTDGRELTPESVSIDELVRKLRLARWTRSTRHRGRQSGGSTGASTALRDYCPTLLI